MSSQGHPDTSPSTSTAHGRRPSAHRTRTHPRTALAIALGRASGGLARRLGISGGTSLPGLVAQYADPRLIERLAAQAQQGCVVVTGTNGKTTTSGLVAYTLRAAGMRIWRNREGSNLARGIATTMLRRAGPTGRLEDGGAGAFVLEVDEAAFARIATDLRPRVLVVTNLFRDQLDRYGEVDTVAERWRESLRKLPPNTTTLALNADDPAVAALGDGFAGPVLFYGVEQTPTHADSDSVAQVIDTRTCPRCRAVLDFAPRFYSHIGHWSCPSCGFHRPTPQVRAAEVFSAGMDEARFQLETPVGVSEVTVHLPGLYNVYNALAAATAATAMQAPLDAIAKGLERFTPAFGRAEAIPVQGRNVRILLTKNPTGLNEVLRALASDRAGGKRLLMLLNDRAADGEDVSWIWDADFEQLAGATAYLVASGTRAYDLALRLKYIGEEPQFVAPNVAAALTHALEHTPPGETLYVIPTYTAMLAVRAELERRGFAPRYWEQEDA